MKGFMPGDLPDNGLREKLLWLIRKRTRMRVTGDSMLPAMREGDEVLVDRQAFHRRPPRVGDIVVACHPFQKNLKIVKRVAAIEADGGCILRGDNPAASSDSRCFGAIHHHRLFGRVTCRLRHNR